MTYSTRMVPVSWLRAELSANRWLAWRVGVCRNVASLPRGVFRVVPRSEGKFNMPFDSIESVLALDAHTLAVGIETNFPSEDGRTPGLADSTETAALPAPHRALRPRARP